MRSGRIMVVLGIAVLATSLAGAGVAGAQSVNRCQVAKKRCVIKKTKGLLRCHVTAETTGLPVDPVCLQEHEDRFDGGAMPAKGCFARLEERDTCLTSGDAAALEAKVDAFVLDVVHALDPGYPAVVLSTCGAGKKKCVVKRAASLLECHAKAEVNGAVNPDCLRRSETGFDGGTRPANGCFAKLEARGGCPTTGDTAALASRIDAFVDDVVCALDPAAPGPCPTVTPTTTPTAMPPTATPTPAVPTDWVGTYDYQGGGEALAVIRQLATALRLLIEFQPGTYMEGGVDILPDGSVGFSGTAVSGGDMVLGPASGSGTATIVGGTSVITGWVTSALVGGTVPFTMSRPTTGTPPALGGTYVFTFVGLSAGVPSSSAMLALSVPPTGIGQSTESADETDDAANLLGTFSPGECLVSPLAKLSCRLPYVHHVPPPPSFPLPAFNAQLGGNLAAGGTVYGDTPPIPHAFPIASWTAAPQPAP